MYPEWQPGDPWSELPPCPHFEGSLHLPRSKPNGETPPFTYRNQHWQGFPAGSHANGYNFCIFNEDLSLRNYIYGVVRNFVTNLDPIPTILPSDRLTYFWQGLPLGESPFYGEPFVHTEMDGEWIPCYNLEEDPFPWYKWLTFESEDQRFTGEVQLYYPQAPGLNPYWFGVEFLPRPSIRYYRHILKRVVGIIPLLAPLAFSLLLMCSGNNLQISSPVKRHKKTPHC